MVFKDRPTIGVFLKGLPGLYFFPLLKGILDACHGRKLNVRTFLSGKLDANLQLNEHSIFNLANIKNMDGIICLSSPVPLFDKKEDMALFISRFAPLPRVYVGAALENVPSIVVENRQGIYDAAVHFIKVHGFQNVAYIGGVKKNPEAILRLEGYKQALADLHIPYKPELFYQGDFTSPSGYEACREFFEIRGSKIDAIVAANDNMALGVCEYCKQKGISIPGDLGLSGFDGLLNAAYSLPPLTTVTQPLYRSGETAVRLVCEQIEKKQVPGLTVLPARLICRSSCGCSFIDEINFGISKKPSRPVPAFSTGLFEKITESRKEVFSYIRDIALIENPVRLQYISDCVLSKISGINSFLYPPGSLQKLIKDTDLSEYELNSWLDYFSHFYAAIKELEGFEQIREQVQAVFSIVVYHLNRAIRYQMGKRGADILEDTYGYRTSISKITASLSLSELLKRVTGEFIALGFDFFYICLWEGRELGVPVGEGPGDYLRLMAGYDGERVIKGYEENIIFKTDLLLPGNYFTPGKDHSFFLFPLLQKGYSFGLLIISNQSDKMGYYSALWDQLCTSLNLIRLFDQARQKQLALNELNVSLENKVAERTEELVAANEKLKEIDRLKTNFFANISHELRTPLTLIMGPLEGIFSGDYGKTIESDNPVFKSVLGNTNRLLKLINNLLDYSKIEAGKMQVVKKKMDIYKLLNYYLSIIQSAGSRRGIDVQLKSRETNIHAWIDRDLLEKALFNLFSNGLKFTPRGGSVTIELDREDNSFSIAVRDTGIGIPRDKLDSVFERFTQVDQGASRKYEGTGIGLAFTREIIGLHDGTIHVDSEQGKGTVFTITLPFGSGTDRHNDDNKHPEDEYEVKESLLSDFETEAALLEEKMKPGEKKAGENDNKPDKPQGQKQEKLRHQKQPDTRKKILVIDDNAQMQTFLTSILSRYYSVVTAENGAVGLEKAAHHLPDLIISDVMMPVMDGIEFCHQIKSREDLNHIPLILLTARTDISLKMNGLNEMADDFLPKPFNSKELLIRIRNLLTVRKLHVEMARQQNTIMSSVGYARKIQNSILPNRADMQAGMKDSFVLWQPRDIVGGDIYWYKQIGDNFIAAVIDCTGHGIPGAFMTMTCQAELNSIVKLVNNDNPGVILWELNNSIKTALNQEKTGADMELKDATDDGLDICLCYYNRQENTLIYAGARRPLYYVQNNRLIEVAPDKMSIGYRSTGFNYKFTNHEISLTGNEIFYLTTDGYADQMGGPEGFCFGTARLKKLLLAIHRENMETQKRILKEQLVEYKKGWKQVDDVTVLCFIPIPRICAD